MARVVFLFFGLINHLFSFGQGSIFNFGFEDKSPGSALPEGWFQWGSGYKISIDTVNAFRGNASALIQPLPKRPVNSFGCLAYSIPAQYDAKEIEVRAYMKMSGVTDGPIGLMIRVDGSSGTLGFENMHGKNIQGTADWKLYSVKIPFLRDVKTIYVGAMLSGNGQLWVDDFELLLDGVDIAEATIAEPKKFKADVDKEFDNDSKISGIVLTESKIQDLDVLGKVWGFVKYHHPSVANGDYNWDYELFRILPKIIEANSARKRNAILTAWISSLGDFDTGADSSASIEEVKLNPDFSWINSESLGGELVNALNKVKSAKRPHEHYYIEVMMNPTFKNERSYGSIDQGFRILSLFRYWNIINYYFPYKYLIEDNWNEVLSEYIPQFVNSTSELEYKLSCLSLIARVADTHANIWGMDATLNSFKGERFAPLKVAFIEGKAVVTDFLDEGASEKIGVSVGDVIETINGRTVDEIVREKLPLTPASNFPTQLRDIARELLRSNEGTLTVEFSNGSSKVTKEIVTFFPMDLDLSKMYSNDNAGFKMIDSDIAYLYPASVKNEDLPAIMEQVMGTKGLIIDFRCYPADFLVFTLGKYLVPKPTPFVKFSKGNFNVPGQFIVTDPVTLGTDNPDYYKGKVIIIVDENTQSSAEYQTMAFRTAPRATVIGSTTAGADGNISRLLLPGDINTMISGIGIYYPDGTETQRVGIVPDVEIRPTITGIREGRDEMLELAIELVRKN